jgi:ParB family chromosome partitioning protein
VGLYKEPLGGHPVLLSILPIDAVEPTAFQRDLSDAHHHRLTDVINKTGRFLDPIIAVVAPKGGCESARQNSMLRRSGRRI